MYPWNLLPVETETEHITSLQAKAIQVADDLLFAIFISALAMPYLHLDDITPSSIMDNHIRSFPIPGLFFYAEGSNAIDDWRKVG